jgi:MoaA/NifB/PqqE/SkfB family radical SAM enzyme
MKKRLCAVAMEENYHELEDIVDFAYKYEFDSITFTPVSIIRITILFFTEKKIGR